MGLLDERSRAPIRTTYRAVGSGTGQAEFVGQASNSYKSYNHFGSGDVPMTKEYYDTLTANGRTMLHVPFCIGAVSFFHSIPDVDMTHAKGLNLTSCLLAKILQREITTWDDAEILAENPNLVAVSPGVVGQNITVVHRALGSSSTNGATQYLDLACPSDWKLGFGKTVAWPDGAVSAQGSGGVSSYLAANPYSISYLDSGFSHSVGLSEIQLRNKAGFYLNSKEADISATADEALKESVIPSSPSADWSAVNLYNLDGNATWPITSLSYFYVDKDSTAFQESGPLLKAFLKFVLSQAGQGMLSEFGFTKLPEHLLTYNNDTLENELVVSGQDWVLELKAETQKYVGAGDEVLSEKRRSYGEYQRTNFAEDLEALQASHAEIEALTRNVTELEKDHAMMMSDHAMMAKMTLDMNEMEREMSTMRAEMAAMKSLDAKMEAHLDEDHVKTTVEDIAIASICLLFLVFAPLVLHNFLAARKLLRLSREPGPKGGEMARV